MPNYRHTEWAGKLYCEDEQTAVCEYEQWDGGTCPECNSEVPATNRNGDAAEV